MDSDRPSSQVGELQAGKIHAFRCPQWLNGVVQTVDTVLCEQAADCIFEVLVFLFSTAFEYDRRFSSFLSVRLHFVKHALDAKSRCNIIWCLFGVGIVAEELSFVNENRLDDVF